MPRREICHFVLASDGIHGGIHDSRPRSVTISICRWWRRDCGIQSSYSEGGRGCLQASVGSTPHGGCCMSLPAFQWPPGRSECGGTVGPLDVRHHAKDPAAASLCKVWCWFWCALWQRHVGVGGISVRQRRRQERWQESGRHFGALGAQQCPTPRRAVGAWHCNGVYSRFCRRSSGRCCAKWYRPWHWRSWERRFHLGNFGFSLLVLFPFDTVIQVTNYRRSLSHWSFVLSVV